MDVIQLSPGTNNSGGEVVSTPARSQSVAPTTRTAGAEGFAN